jgi:hypothetical protein
VDEQQLSAIHFSPQLSILYKLLNYILCMTVHNAILPSVTISPGLRWLAGSARLTYSWVGFINYHGRYASAG